MGACVLGASALWGFPPGQASAADDDCLGCHGDTSLRGDKGRSLYVNATHKQASVHAGLSCTDCHEDIQAYPHPRRPKKIACASCHADAPAPVRASVHGGLGEGACQECHGPAHAVRPLGGKAGESCVQCHEDAVTAFRTAIHGQQKAGSGGPTCQSCHGAAHDLVPVSQPSSPVAKRNLPATCGACHANPDFVAKHKIPLARPIESYRLSVHGRALAAGNDKAAACSDCHESHAILPARDPRSKINHWAVARTCGSCHGEIQKAYAGSVHGQAVANGIRESPTCTDCHGEHAILAPSEPESLVNPARVSTATCGRCHADERLAAKYNLPRDRLPSFEASFHGLALRGGRPTVANCASCHGVHNILPSKDPRSTVHAANLGKTCGACHPGAGERFGIGPVHVLAAGRDEHKVVRAIRVSYLLFLIPVFVGLMTLHNLLDFFAKLVRGTERERLGGEVVRMSFHFRVAHLLVVVSFPLLVLTGFALTYPDAWWAAPLAQVRGTLHRIAAVLLLISMAYHAIHLLLSRRDRVILKHLLPAPSDAKDAWDLIRHNLGFKVRRPHFGKFSYAEKAEYWAFMWGSLVMAASGFLLWFNNWSLAHLPKWVSDAATAVHLYEAVLASLSILVWHFYIVVFDPDVYPMDRAWITGKASADHLLHTRPAYFRALSAEGEPATNAAPTAKPPADVTGPKDV